MSVPLDPANRHYAEILRQVEAGELTIEEADSDV
jgi:antitoxin (DNA-binding transcriptional repressor) of toxin-antitoxin stability system